MKGNDKRALLALSGAELITKLRELERQVSAARQNRIFQDRTQVNIREAYHVRQQIQMIKTEMRRRELTGETV